MHGTSHHLGLDVHDVGNFHIDLNPGNVFTVEPGIYIPNKFGVRIEDSVIVRDRPIIMHKFPKDLIVI